MIQRGNLNPEGGGKGVVVGASEEYAAFDALPLWARDAIRHSPYPFSALTVLQQIERFQAQGVPMYLIEEKYGPYLTKPRDAFIVQAFGPVFGPIHPQLDPSYSGKPI